MTTLVAQPCGCVRDYFSGKRPEKCECGNRLRTPAELAPKERAPPRRVSLKRQAEIDAGERPRQTSTLKPGRGFAVAPAQRAKVKLLVCLGCGREVDPDASGEWTIDPAHLVPRSAGGCDDALCVLPLCRHHYISTEGCHPIFDGKVPGKRVNLHVRIARGGYEAELAHAIREHGWTPLELHQRLTGEMWVPRRELEVATARVVELESGVRA